MRSDYGSLRTRTRDSGWQWMLIGVFLGVGLAMVACVGMYAVGALTFPVLEENTATPRTQIMPNETEVALQLTLGFQTAVAAVEQTQQSDTPDLTREMAVVGTSAPSPTPSPLPGSNGAEQSQTVETPTPTQTLETQAQVESLPQISGSQGGTPVLGTPPVNNNSADLVGGMPTGPSIPPELDALKTDLVPVTGGTFMMGTTLDEANQAMDECALYNKTCDDLSWVQDSTPQHQTTVDSFQIEVYEVSIQQYVAFLNWMGPNSHKAGCQGQPCALTTVEKPDLSYVNFDGETYSVRNPEFNSRRPMTFVTWWGAVDYCRAINRRLPTEAEWERAARGSNNFIYPWGFEFDTTRAVSSVPQAMGTVPVNEFPNGASPYGAFNMAGNASEWVSDWYQFDYYSQQAVNPEPNPKGPVTGTDKVHRGGSWDTIPLFLRTVHRLTRAPGDPTASIGFRCVASASATAPQLVAPSASDSDQAAPGNAQPTLPPQPTRPPLPTNTPAGPAPTLDPGTN